MVRETARRAASLARRGYGAMRGRPDDDASAERPGGGAAATMDDVHAAYRLLLRRSPDDAGLAHYRSLVERGGVSRDQVVTDLLHSPEFARLHPDLVTTSAVSQQVDAGGFTMVVNPLDGSIGAWIAEHGDYEPELTAVVRGLLGPGSTFVDIGANLGWYSLVAAPLVTPGGRVVAIEPHPGNCRMLRESMALNGYTIDVVVAAAADRPGWLGFSSDGTNGWVAELAGAEPIACAFVVPATPVDDVLARLSVDHVDVVKVDVEGFEPRVFAGSHRLLEEMRPVVLFEWFPLALAERGGFDAREPLGFLRERDYEIRVVGSDGPPLDDAEIEAARRASGRELLELIAVPAERDQRVERYRVAYSK